MTGNRSRDSSRARPRLAPGDALRSLMSARLDRSFAGAARQKRMRPEHLTKHWIAAATMMVNRKSPAPEDQWAFDWFILPEAEDMWSAIVAIARATTDEGVLGLLGAGPLENFIERHGRGYLNAIEKEAANNPAFAFALGGAWQGDTTDEDWQAIQQIKARITT
jgi:hypothetical protein